MWANYLTADAVVTEAARSLDEGVLSPQRLITAKLMSTELVFRSVECAAHIYGGAGVIGDQTVGARLLDAITLFSPAGTSDVNRGLLSALPRSDASLASLSMGPVEFMAAM